MIDGGGHNCTNFSKFIELELIAVLVYFIACKLYLDKADKNKTKK